MNKVHDFKRNFLRNLIFGLFILVLSREMIVCLNLRFNPTITASDILARARGSSSGGTSLTTTGGSGNSLETNSNGNNLTRNNLFGRNNTIFGANTGSSGSNISGFGTAYTGTTGGSDILLTPFGGLTSANTGGATVLGILNGTGRTASSNEGGSSIENNTTNAVNSLEGMGASAITGRGNSTTLTTGAGGLYVGNNSASGASETHGESGLNVSSGEGAAGTSTRSHLNISRGGSSANSISEGSGITHITGSGSGSTTSHSTNSANISGL